MHTKPFLSEDFLLQSGTAQRLYHEYAAGMPIIDFHSHLPPDQIADDHVFSTITEAWLHGDHYKWRAMRAFGIAEEYISGGAPDLDKFRKWAQTVPYTIGNPLFHWTHLELKNYFGINGLLSPETADAIYRDCNGLLATRDFSTRNLLLNMNVEVACTTDDPVATLEEHRRIRDDGFAIKVLPTFRPDSIFMLNDTISWNKWVDQLGIATGIPINDLAALLDAMDDRIAHFHEHGCRVSDHGFSILPRRPAAGHNPAAIFTNIRGGGLLTPEEQNSLAYPILVHLSRSYHRQGWVQQFHLGALRNTNTRLFRSVGPNAGTDSVGGYHHGETLAGFLDELDKTDQLAKTILYNLNPADNALFATMAGNFNDGSIRGKIQYGPAWWFLDQKDGIEEQLKMISNMGLLSCFVGMLTDSRSFLSFPRHEYFRRILCNVIGRNVEAGELPADIPWLGGMITDICYNNAKNYFEF